MQPALDQMICEAALFMPQKAVSPCDAHVHSINLWPRRGQANYSRHRGVIGRALDDNLQRK
jgi:hypothetical protein